MKKFNLNNYVTKRKVLEFLDRKGFYVVLFLCIGIITVTAYTVTKRNISSFNDNSAFEELSKDAKKPDARLAIGNKPANNTTQEKGKKQPEQAKPSANVVKSAQKPAQAEKTQPKQQESVKPKQIKNLDFPVLGQVTQDFAKSNLVYSKTLEEWTTHNGLDIGADRGTPVKAAQDGVVSDIYTDSRYGITIVIDHGNGLKTRYSNLSTDNMTRKGTKVTKGQVISGIGSTAMFEAGEQPHVHFEVLQDGVNVNPKNYIK